MARPEQYAHLPRGDQAREQTELNHRRFHRLSARASSKPHPRYSHHAATAPERVISRSAACSEFALLLNQFRAESGPASLMRRAEAGTDISVKIFVEQIAGSCRGSRRLP